MKKKIFILLSVLALGCNKDETNNVDMTDLKLVTGINLKQNFDDPPIQVGNPNVLVNNMFSIYPNPAQDMIAISAQEDFTDVWIVKANPRKIYQDVNFSDVLNTNLYSEQLIKSNSSLFVNSWSSNLIFISIDSLEKGYYKVFVKIDGGVYWDNLYKYDSQEDTTEQFTSIINFWN